MSEDTIINWIAFGSGAIAIQAMLYRLYIRALFQQKTREIETRRKELKELRDARFEQVEKEYQYKRRALRRDIQRHMYPVTPLLITEHQWQISGIEEEHQKEISDNPARFNR